MYLQRTFANLQHEIAIVPLSLSLSHILSLIPFRQYKYDALRRLRRKSGLMIDIIWNSATEDTTTKNITKTRRQWKSIKSATRLTEMPIVCRYNGRKIYGSPFAAIESQHMQNVRLSRVRDTTLSIEFSSKSTRRYLPLSAPANKNLKFLLIASIVIRLNISSDIPENVVTSF